MPELSGQDVLKRMAGMHSAAEIIVVTANDSVQAAVECIRSAAGAGSRPSSSASASTVD